MAHQADVSQSLHPHLSGSAAPQVMRAQPGGEAETSGEGKQISVRKDRRAKGKSNDASKKIDSNLVYEQALPYVRAYCSTSLQNVSAGSLQSVHISLNRF